MGKHDSGARHWPALDGLRGVAVAGVVAYHLGWISGGFLGVDLFFVLSGFLITSLLVGEARSEGRIDVVQFWLRRFRRLLPAVAVMLAGVLVWSAVWATPAEQATARAEGRWGLVYLANWHLVDSVHDYWAAATSSSVFVHLWSLAIEEQFYVVWPIVVWVVLRRSAAERVLVAVVVAGAVASITAMAVLYDPALPGRVYFGTDTRAFALLMGALVAAAPVRRVLERWADGRSSAVTVAVSISCALLATSWLVGGSRLDLLLQGGLAIHSLVAATVVALVTVGPNRPWRALSNPVLVWLGRRSYGIYLWHWPVIALLAPRLQVGAGASDAIVIAASIVLAELSFRLVEHPIRRQTGWAAGSRAGAATLAAVGLAAVAVVVSPSGRGHVASFDVGAIAAPAAPTATARTSSPAAARPEASPAASHAASPFSDRTAQGFGARLGIAPDVVSALAASLPEPRPVITTVLWLGDSVAADLAPAVMAALGAAGVGVASGAFDGARLVAADGVDHTPVFVALLDELPTDVVVVELSFWDSPFPVEQQRAAITWIRDEVVARGGSIVFVTPPPVRADLVDPGLARQVALAAELVAADPDHVRLVDATTLWGTELDVDIGDDLAPDRKPDGVHVCPQGAARFAAWLVDELAADFGGLTPQFPTAWAGGGWTADARYDTPVGACVVLTAGS